MALLFNTVLLSICPAPVLAAEEKPNFSAERLDLYEIPFQDLAKLNFVSAAKSPEKISDIPASVIVITRTEIEQYGYTVLDELLRHIPGLYPINDYHEGPKFGVRGFWSGVANRNMAILVNGVKQLEDRDQSNPLTKIAVPIESIDRVEVVRGPMSVIYGPGAMFGVINIITNQSDGDSSRISSSFGSLDSRRLFARLSNQTDEGQFVINSSIYSTRGIDEPYTSLQSSPSPGTAGLGTGGRLEDEEKYLNFSGTYKSISLDASYTHSEKEFFFPLPAVADGSLRTTNALNISIGSQNKISDSLTIEGKLLFSKNSAALKYDIRRPNWIGNQRWSSSAYDFELNAFYQPNARTNLTFGFNYRSVFDVSDRFHIPSSGFPSTQNAARLLEEGEEIVTQAIYSQLSLNPTSKLLLVAGLRMERQLPYALSDSKAGGLPEFTYSKGKFDKDEVTTIPRIAAIFKPTESHLFKLMYGEAINRPSFLQNITNTLDPNRDSLKPEDIKTFELNYLSVINEKHQVNLSLFRNSLSNLINRQALFVNGDYETFSDNGGRLITNGIEMTVQSRIMSGLSIELSSTLQETRDQAAKNRTVAYSPRALAYLKLNYRISEKTSFSLTANYVGSMRTFYDITLVDPSQGIGSPQKGRIGNEVDGYYSLGLNFRIEDLYIKDSYINFRGTNLLDETIRYPSFTTNAWADKGSLEVGPYFHINFGWKFGSKI